MSDLQKTSGPGLKTILVQLYLTFMVAATNFYNTLNAGSAAETYFAVRFMAAYPVS